MDVDLRLEWDLGVVKAAAADGSFVVQVFTMGFVSGVLYMVPQSVLDTPCSVQCQAFCTTPTQLHLIPSSGTWASSRRRRPTGDSS